jgi:antitoxin component YwqK of YwqJK toxin-antitoxin module
MNKLLLCAFLLFLSFGSVAQTQNRVLYVVDSITVVNDPNEDDQLINDDIDAVEVVTSPDRIKQIGYDGKIDKIIYVTTKAYTQRPAAIRSIPSTKAMVRKNGVWQLKDVDKPYSGPFIDYFMNGRKQGEGTIKDGLVDGVRTVYYPNGNKRYFYTYAKGIENGASEEYFSNGNIKQKGSFVNKKEVGLWQQFYSTGNLKKQSSFLNDKQDLTKEDEKFYALLEKGISLMHEEDYAAAIKKFDAAEKLKQGYADLYFYRGTAKLDLFDFDNALIELDKAVAIEPLYMEAIANRAFARLRKYQFKDSRTISKSKEVTILATKDKVPIPKDDLDKICADLNLANTLGDKNAMILDAIKEYCK